MISRSPVRPAPHLLPNPRLRLSVLRTPALLILVLLVFGSRPLLGPELVLGLATALGLALYRLSPPSAAARPWTLYLLALLFFSHLRAFADDLGPSALLQYPLHADQALFGGVLPTRWLQDQLYQPGRFGPADWAAITIHFSFFVLPNTVALLLWRLDPTRFRRYVAALVLTLK